MSSVVSDARANPRHRIFLNCACRHSDPVTTMKDKLAQSPWEIALESGATLKVCFSPVRRISVPLRSRLNAPDTGAMVMQCEAVQCAVWAEQRATQRLPPSQQRTKTSSRVGSQTRIALQLIQLLDPKGVGGQQEAAAAREAAAEAPGVERPGSASGIRSDQASGSSDSGITSA